MTRTTFHTRLMTATASIIASLTLTHLASAEVVEYYFFEDAETNWEAAAGDWQTIDFTGLPESTVLSDQYQTDFGVVFETMPFQTVALESDIFVHDGSGARITTIDFPSFGAIITFDTPLRALAVDHPGAMFVYLTLADGTVFESFPGGSGVDQFSGWTSDVPIVQIEIGDFGGSFSMDDLRLAPIPGPSGAAMLGLAALIGGSHRRRRGRRPPAARPTRSLASA